MSEESFLGGRVVVKIGDITRQETDAVVNAANWTLMGGGGVDGAIHRAGGPRILEECRQLRRTRYPDGLPAGQAVITTGGDLKARFVIHTVGPVYGRNGGRDAELLADCYQNSLRLAAENNLRTISFPSISTGAFYYPKPEAARVSSLAIREFLSQDNLIKQICLVFFSPGDAKIFSKHNCF